MFKRLQAAAELEDHVLEYWERERIFERSLEGAEDKPHFVFFEGPPTANGTPHNGHVLTRVIKDVIPRYRTMRGDHVARKAGWDTHGLPVEVEVEKRLGIHGREAIEEFGIEAFSRECVESVFTYVQDWEQLTKQIGFWVDLDAYVTYHRSYVESVWWALSELFHKGLLYKGHKVVWWWPQGGTTLSAAEVGLGYKEVDDPAITVRFRDADDPSVTYLAWTTTPWTLASNVALAVGEKIDYALCDDPEGEGTVVLAAALAEGYGLTPREVVKGTALLGKRYVPLYDFGAPEGGKSYLIVPAHHVTTKAGSGIVHTAPAFGEDDMLVAKQQGLGLLQWVEPSGNFAPGTGFLAGKFCKDADPEIIDDLRDRGLLFKQETVRHDYPFCWRADSDPLIQYARPAWFIRTTERIDEAIANNQAVGWLPEHIKDGRFGDFLRNNVDWALSRERFWGTPLNIWICESCEAHLAPASMAEIERLAPGSLDPSVDIHLQIHRPWIDGVELPCTCGGTMKRVPEVIDCWFDSGCMPFAQWGFPHQNVETFKQNFPADFISEAVDQTRGWFYSLLMISTLLFDDETCARYGMDPVGIPRPYRNCVVLGHVCDVEGRKESKSKGNYTSPNLVLRGRTRLAALPDPAVPIGSVGLKSDQIKSLDLDSSELITVSVSEAPEAGALACTLVAADVGPKDTVHLHPDALTALGLPATGGKVWFRIPIEPPGADAFRWLFIAASPAWSNTRLSMRAIREGQREFLIRLRNVYQFFGIYANIAQENGSFDPVGGTGTPVANRSSLDRWILHRLDETVRKVTENMDRYLLYDASRWVLSLVDDLSNWYVRRSRSRFWGEGDDLKDALWTLYEVLVTTSKLIAPFVPFMAEAMFQELTSNADSVHLASWPEADDALADPQLGTDMALVRELASLGLAARSASRIKVRQPLGSATMVLADPSGQGAVERLAALLRDELNVREIVFAEDSTQFVSYQVKPDFKKLGPRLGKDVKRVAQALAGMDGGAVKRALDVGALGVDLGDKTVEITADDVVLRVEQKGDYEAASSTVAVVALATGLDEDLRSEGMVRELVSRVQQLRRELDLGYTQRIDVQLDADSPVTAALERFGSYLQGETLATSLDLAISGVQSDGWELREWEVDGHAVKAAVRPHR